MKIIGAGYSRTGTMSMKSALAKLGYRSYHMEEAVMNFEKGDLDKWNDYMEGRSDMDWQKLFAGYDATADLPAAFYYREQMAAFPDAKVILTVRDPEAWWQSTAKLVKLHNTLVEPIKFIPRFGAFQRLFRNCERTIANGSLDHDHLVARFNAHNANEKATVSPERLLVFEVKDGWEPLCKFLGAPVPAEPFPHENAGIATVDKMMKRLILTDLIKLAWPWLAGLVVVIVALIQLLAK